MSLEHQVVYSELMEFHGVPADSLNSLEVDCTVGALIKMVCLETNKSKDEAFELVIAILKERLSITCEFGGTAITTKSRLMSNLLFGANN